MLHVKNQVYATWFCQIKSFNKNQGESSKVLYSFYAPKHGSFLKQKKHSFECLYTPDYPKIVFDLLYIDVQILPNAKLIWIQFSEISWSRMM